MTVYKLRDKITSTYYDGSGRFTKNGKLYTSKGHIKNSLTQSWGRKYRPNGRDLEIVMYDLTELIAEPI